MEKEAKITLIEIFKSSDIDNFEFGFSILENNIDQFNKSELQTIYNIFNNYDYYDSYILYRFSKFIKSCSHHIPNHKFNSHYIVQEYYKKHQNILDDEIKEKRK